MLFHTREFIRRSRSCSIDTGVRTTAIRDWVLHSPPPFSMTISTPDKKNPHARGPPTLVVRSRVRRSREKSRRARGGGTPRRAANASKTNQRVNRASLKRRAATTRGVDRSRARAVGKPYVRFRIQIQSPASDAFDATRARAER